MIPPIKAALGVILSPRPTPDAVRTVVAFVHKAATVYLRHKQAAGSVGTSWLGLSVDDLALDCIGGLFERDGAGCFPILRRYFEGIGWKELPEQDLQGGLRRLVFSRVNQELYRTYKESDPTLHRIIRNIKESTQSTPGILLGTRGGENWLSFAEESATRDLPTAPPEYLGPYVQMLIARGLETPGLLEALRQIMLQQSDYRSGYPVVPLALLIREAYAALADDQPAQSVAASDVEEKIYRQDIARVLRDTVSAVEERLRSSHVDRRKLAPELLTVYASVTSHVLREQYLESTDERASYFEQLQRYLPGLTSAEYKENHRSILEYMVKMAREAFLTAIREDV